MLTNERLGRLAVSSIAAVVGGIVLLNLCANPIRAMATWLLYSVVCAILLNSQEGEELRTLSTLALLPAITPLLVLIYPLLFLNEGICFSGVLLTGRAAGPVIGLCLFFFVVSYIAITLFAFGRAKVLAAVTEQSTAQMARRIKSIEAAIRALTALAGSASLLYIAMTK
jgi:hypothetical protein